MNSDTESESGSITPIATTSRAPSIPQQPQATTNLSVADAIHTLATTAQNAVSSDSDVELHSNTLAAASSLDLFLDGMLSEDASQKQDICASMHTFMDILNESFLTALFFHRKALHSLLRTTSKPSTSAPWTDILLLKICRLITLVSTGNILSSTQILHPQALWTVGQLPYDLKCVPSVAHSAYSSPALRNLALQLAFGACIIRPSITGGVARDSMCLNSGDIDGIAQFYGDMAVRRATELNEDERSMCAMAVVLCSTFMLSQEQGKTSLPSRPYLTSLLFSGMHALVEDHRFDSLNSSALNTSQIILLSWGDVLPWCWHSCSDPRSADMPLVSLITALWLCHQSRGRLDNSWTEAVLNLLRRDISLSATHILLQQLLCQVEETLRDGHDLNQQDTLFTYQICWSMAQISHPLLENRVIFSADAIHCMCMVFIKYASSGTGLSVVECALQVLLYARSSDIQTIAERLIEGRQFLSAFDKAVTCMKRLLSSSEDATAAVCFAQSLLAVVTIFGYHEAQIPCYSSSVTALDFTVSNYVEAGLDDSRSLAISLAVAAPQLGVGGHVLSEQEIVCLLHLEQSHRSTSTTLNLMSAAALSSYIVSGNPCLQDMSALLQMEIWDVLRDVLVLIVERRFMGEEETVAILVAPVLGHALSRMVACGDARFVQCIAESSWTASLYSRLQSLLQSQDTDDDSIHAALSSRLARSVRPLLDFNTRGCSHADDEKNRIASQLVFHTSADLMYLIPAPAP